MPTPHLSLYRETADHAALDSGLNAVQSLQRQIHAKYHERMSAAGLLGRMYLSFKMKHELRSELEKLAPRIEYLLRR